ncbi:S-layer homology domain-containing protein [Collinsella ihumii]|uniref:S-layer homology domain-containing protein n=1 Tax=Collinsella ihumii TaxID=1720204 RepID=A0AAW7JL37_9ACTN|nr:S-layer homology domain-containing protein [Collinsella ihumii]MDN0068218.1 S-layer homology domain-containing protein [Collinsella ihumii]
MIRGVRSIFAGLGLVSALLLPCAPAYAATEPLSIDSATWQDPSHVMLIWDSESNVEYEVLKSDSEHGDYAVIGTSDTGSFLDADASWPDSSYYKIQPVGSSETGDTAVYLAIKSGTNARHVSKVSAIMYHNFITEEDQKNGVEFEEYSLDPSDFEEDLQYLRNNGYTTITSADVIDYINGDKPLPAKAVIISIDDGTWGVYTNAWPLLQKYNMKADFNVIGRNIDDTWDDLQTGGTRDGQSAPYCEWGELCEMVESGAINLCSHTYGMHVYDSDGRIGASMMEGESLADYISAVSNDYALSASCIGGWTGINPTTMAYPYSKRSEETDEAILSSTGYELLMGGYGARGTQGNYFVDGASPESQLRIMSRPCRMDGTPLSDYLNDIDEQDGANGVNTLEDTSELTDAECREMAQWYTSYDDVDVNEWYSGPVYFAYVNSLLLGTSPSTFEPYSAASRAMVMTVLYRLEGSPTITDLPHMADVAQDSWYIQPMAWAVESGMLKGVSEGIYEPDRAITREEMAAVLKRYAEEIDLDAPDSGVGVDGYPDANAISSWARSSFDWAVRSGIIKGSNGYLNPQGTLDRAQLTTMLMRFVQMM